MRSVTAAEQPEACAALRAEADEVVCLYAPPSFSAVGNYYLRFEQTSDDEVRRLLRCEPRLASDAEAGELPRSPRLHPSHLMVQPKAVIARLGVSGEAPFRSRLRRPNTRGGRTRWHLHRS